MKWFGAAYVESFALRLFERAENEEKAEKLKTYSSADYLSNAKSNRKNFYAASHIMDVLNLFGPIDDIMEKQRYSKYRAVSLLKLMKQPSIKPESSYGEGLSEPEPKVVDSTPMSKTLGTTADASPTFTMATSSPDSLSTGAVESPVSLNRTSFDLDQAIKNSRFAISALQYEDISAAKKYLELALSNLS
ncbi:hypothetical protein BC829DRAFT_401919 [Chytridium lagenaria]|nr:hypothetical protein BC829DRAFT_401919 [Chytridium lagenaria]